MAASFGKDPAGLGFGVGTDVDVAVELSEDFC